MHSQSLSTIVVLIDYTETSLNALTVAARLGQQQQAGVYLVHVTESNNTSNQKTDHLGSVPAENRAPSTAEGEAMIQTLAMQTTQQYQVRCSGTCRAGELVGEIVTMARKVDADLIVAGIRLGNDKIALRQATNAYQLVEMAHCPVLTIPDGHDWPVFERVLFPVRPVPGALDKYEFARQLLTKQRAELLILALFSPDEIISRDQLEEDIRALNVKLTQDGVTSHTQFWPTELMAETVLEKAVENQADLLVITATLITTSTNFFTGPFARQILYNAPLPVLAIRPERSVCRPESRVVWQSGLLNSEQTDQDL